MRPSLTIKINRLSTLVYIKALITILLNHCLEFLIKVRKGSCFWEICKKAISRSLWTKGVFNLYVSRLYFICIFLRLLSWICAQQTGKCKRGRRGQKQVFEKRVHGSTKFVNEIRTYMWCKCFFYFINDFCWTKGK